jgi:ribosomal protein L7/L12
MSKKEVVDALDTIEGKIGAIKAFRKVTGCGLAEAKKQVEYFIDFNGWNPDFVKDFNLRAKLVNSGTKIQF